MNTPLCNEISRIFQTGGKFRTSAATLRILVGRLSGNEEISNGTQQDITDLVRLLLQQMEKELSNMDGAAGIFITKFWGKENATKKFVNDNAGKCIKCNKVPREEQENFNILKLHVLQTTRNLSLTSLNLSLG